MKQILFTLTILTFLLLPNVAFCLPDFPPADHLVDSRWSNLGLFFAKHKCPDFNYQLIDDYINAADKYQIDWRLLPAISLQESSCGRHYRLANFWGWNSARTGFESVPIGIDYVTRQLAEGRYYKDKSIKDKLHSYNPEPSYAGKILRLMEEIK